MLEVTTPEFGDQIALRIFLGQTEPADNAKKSQHFMGLETRQKLQPEDAVPVKDEGRIIVGNRLFENDLILVTDVVLFNIQVQRSILLDKTANGITEGIKQVDGADMLGWKKTVVFHRHQKSLGGLLGSLQLQKGQAFPYVFNRILLFKLFH